MTFRHIRVRRMPGFAVRGFAVEGLCDGVNIVSGPNGSGKSTTAIAIHALLWPAQAAPQVALLDADVEVDGEVRSVTLTGRQATYEGAPPEAGPAANRDRYWLSLQDLLQSDTTSFAEAVLREARGGYDLGSAKKELAYSALPKQPNKQRDALLSSRRKVREARQANDRAAADERRLGDLEAERAEAQRAGRRAALLAAALGYGRARGELEDAQGALDELDPRLAQLDGAELEDVESLRQQAAKKLDAMRGFGRGIRQALYRRREARVSRDSLTEPDLSDLGARVRDWRELVRRRQEIGSARETCAGHAAAALRDLGPEADQGRLRDLDMASLADVAAFARDAGQIADERSALEAMRAWLGAPLQDGPSAAELQRGIDALTHWLLAGEPAPRVSPWLAAAAGFMVAAGVLLAAWVHMAASGITVGGVALLAWLLLRRPDGSVRAMREQDYRRANLPLPDAWTDESVHKRIRSLQSEHANRVLEEEREQRWETVLSQHASLAERESGVAERAEGLQAALSTVPGPDAHGHHAAGLCLWVERVRRWKEADVDLQARDAELAELDTKEAGLRERIAAVLARVDPIGAPAPEALVTVEDADSRVQDLDRRTRDHRSAVQDINTGCDLARAAASDRRQLVAQRNQVYIRLGLAPDDRPGLQALVDRRKDWTDAQKGVERARGVLRQAWRLLDEAGDGAEPARGKPDVVIPWREAMRAWQAHSVDEGQDRTPEPASPAVADLEGEHRRETEIAARLEALTRESVECQTRIGLAKDGHAMEDALAEEYEARCRLSDAREQAVSSAIGWMLAQAVEESSRDEDLPTVFAEARTLFARITGGRYELRLDRGASAFSAYDTVDGALRSLDQLSSGTRVQLLIAARMAFVATREQGPALPLLLDETLADTDATRSRIVVRAVLEACRQQRRQVFYFTCKAEEVARWREAADEMGVPWALVELPPTGAPPDPVSDAVAPEPPPVPPYDGLTHEQYGRTLGVQPFDGRVPKAVASAHLWHFLGSDALLRELLTLGIGTWGQLQSVMRSHAAPGFMPEAAWRKAQAVARVYEEASRLARIGHAPRFGPEHLEKAGVLTIDRYREQLPMVAEQLHWDGTRMLEALSGGAVRGFHRSAIDRLRGVLEEAGLLDDRDPLTADAIHAGAVAQALALVRSGELPDEVAARVVACACAGIDTT